MAHTYKKTFYIISIVIIAYLFLFSLIRFGFWFHTYQQRFKACDPYPIISLLKKTYSDNFPDNIRDIKAVKSIPIDRAIHFSVKFNAVPDDINNLLKAFLKEGLLQEDGKIIRSYSLGSDCRDRHFYPNVPEWFIKPIPQGQIWGTIYKDSTAARFYIDTSNKDFFIVYIKGAYSTRH